jgi:hypothetical protein
MAVPEATKPLCIESWTAIKLYEAVTVYQGLIASGSKKNSALPQFL